MFASEMKILTLTATANASAAKNAPPQHKNSNHNSNTNQLPSNNNSGCNNNNTNKQQNSPKFRYLTTTNKYHSNNNNNYINNRNSKKNHNNSYNNNPSSSLNRKKYYQQQQQQYITNNNNNNNNSSVKNQNISSATTHIAVVDTQTLSPKNTKHHNNNNNNCISSNNNNCNDDTSLSHRNCQEQLQQQPQQDTSSATAKQFLQAPNVKATTNSSPSKSNKSNNSNCSSCWTNFTKLQANKLKQTPSNSSASSSVCSNSSNDFQEFVSKSKITNSSNNKKKTYWKNNHSCNFNLDVSNKLQQQSVDNSAGIVDNDKQLSNSDILLLNGVVVADSRSGVSLRYQQYPRTATTSEMTTALATAAPTSTTNSTTSSTPVPISKSTANVADTATTTSSNPSPTEESSRTAIGSSKAATVSAPTSPNSYTLDFLHSVGVQMTGGSNIRAVNTNINNMRSSGYSSQSTTASPARQSYNYSNSISGQRQNRYVSSGGQQLPHHYQQHHNNMHQHHHHQPQQLTIASFMQKELTDSLVGGSGNNNNSAGNGNTYDNQQHYSGQQRYQNYYQPFQPQHHPHNYSTMQASYNSVGENASRNISNGHSGASGGGQRQQSYHKYHNGGFYQQNSRHNQNIQNQNNSNNCIEQSSHNYQQQNKKSNYASSSNSSSSSSASSASSVSSQTSGTQFYRQQQSSQKSSSNLNLAIETLPSKSNHSTSQRLHRLQLNHHQHQHMYHHQHSGATTPTTPQHQNFYNLTYVSTDPHVSVASAATTSISTSRASSPRSPPLNSKIDSPALLLSFSQQANQMNNRYHQQLQFSQPPQHFQHNQAKLLPPLSLSVPSPSPTPPSQQTIICCSQLDEASTTAAAAAAVAVAASNESLISSMAASTTNSIIAGNEYDSDGTSSTHSTTLTQKQIQRQKYKQMKSTSLSSSSSASSTTSASSAQENPIPKILHSPVDFAYTFALQQPQQQQFPHQFGSHQHMSPQHPHYRNGVVSLLNLPSSTNYGDDEIAPLHLPHTQYPAQQTPSPQQFYFASGEHMNVAASVPAVSSGYWSPSPNSLQHTNFLYSASNMLSVPSCASSTASLSPRMGGERDEHQQQTMSTLSTEQRLQGNQLKRSQLSSSTSTLQRNTQMTNSGTLRVRGRSQQHHQPMSNPFQQHNLLYGSSQHLRSSSTSSAHDFFSHTPPDRFLARAHLIEAKEAPSTLLNNSRFDMLSQNIWNKFISYQQTEETFKQKMRLWRYLYIIIKNAYPRYGLYLVGSTISGFGADTSDVDMCLVSRSSSSIDPRMEALFNLTVLRDCLSKSGEFENFNLIEAKVPILRFRDRIHQLEVDLNFNNCVGIKNTHLLYCYSQLDWRLRPLVLVTKLWAQYHNINNAKNMTISSYSLVLMVIHFLQYAVSPPVLPCLHDMFPEKFPLLRSNDFGYVDMNECMGPYESKNTQTIGELFLNFLEYYSCFDYTQLAISVRTGGLLPINICRQAKSLKNDIHQWKELCIEEPFDLTNTARSVYDFETFERVKAVFITSWRVLHETLDLNSVFSPIPIVPNSVSTTNSKLLEQETLNTIYPKKVEPISVPSEPANPEELDERLEREVVYKNINNGSQNSKNFTTLAS